MLIVTGASGKLGRRIVEQLLKLVSPDQIGICLRDPDKAHDLAAQGVRVRYGDFAQTDSLGPAFEGVRRLLIVSSNAAATGGDTLGQHRHAIAAAKDAGAERVFYTSQIACAAASLFAPARIHAATEAMLAASGLRWTGLRHGFYAASGMAMTQRGVDADLITAPQDGPVSWTSHDDLALADALLLAGQRAEVDGPTPPLTGPEALDFAAIAALASGLWGKTIAYQRQSDQEMRTGAKAQGLPDSAIEFMMGYFHAARAGEFAAIDPTLERLIRRKPQSMRDVMRLE